MNYYELISNLVITFSVLLDYSLTTLKVNSNRKYDEPLFSAGSIKKCYLLFSTLNKNTLNHDLNCIIVLVLCIIH